MTPMKIDVDAQAVLEKRVAELGGPTKAAKSLGISGAYLLDLRNGHRAFSDRMLEKLGLRKTVVVR